MTSAGILSAGAQLRISFIEVNMPPTLWKVTCEERSYPGLWKAWFRKQCVAVGWPPRAGFLLEGPTRKDAGWASARRSLLDMEEGDWVVVALHGHRIARLGRILEPLRDDRSWEPLIPVTREPPYGEKGRLVRVQWDMEVGPEETDKVVHLPEDCQLSNGELRPTIARVMSRSLEEVRSALSDPSNWVSLWGYFSEEKALSGYIAAFPNRLEDGLVPLRGDKAHQRVLRDGTRLDVLLEDRQGRAVIVECKQGPPSIEAIAQLRQYMALFRRERRRDVRGILVHGGSSKLRADVRRAARTHPSISLVSHRLDVTFSACR